MSASPTIRSVKRREGGKHLLDTNPRKTSFWQGKKKAAKARRTRYQNTVKATASQIFRRRIQGGVQVYFYHFHKGHVIDLDNLEKPILDALSGIAYDDDIQVERKNTERVNLNASTTISGVTTTLIPKALAEKKDCVVVGIKPAE